MRVTPPYIPSRSLVTHSITVLYRLTPSQFSPCFVISSRCLVTQSITVSPCFVISSQFLPSPNIQVGHRPQQVDLCTAGGGAVQWYSVQCTAGTVYSCYSVQCTVYSRWPCTVWGGGAAVYTAAAGTVPICIQQLSTRHYLLLMWLDTRTTTWLDQCWGPTLLSECVPDSQDVLRGAEGQRVTDLCIYIKLERTTLLVLAETVTVPPALI